MNERTGSSAVIDMSKYRSRAAEKPQKPVQQPIPDNLLDTISYHLLMAGRAIAAYSNK